MIQLFVHSRLLGQFPVPRRWHPDTPARTQRLWVCPICAEIWARELDPWATQYVTIQTWCERHGDGLLLDQTELSLKDRSPRPFLLHDLGVLARKLSHDRPAST